MQATRRTAITVSGVAAVGLMGCTADGSGSSATSGPSPSSATEPAAPDPDRAALDRAADLSADLLALATAAGIAGDPGGRFSALHRAHLAALALAGGTSATPTPSQTPPAGPRAGARLSRREAAAQRELAALSQDAQSGALARLLASMSAGIAAHVAALPRKPVR